MTLSKFMAAAEKLKQARKEIAELGAKEGGEAIREAFAPAFEPPTNLTKIVWTQYTPFFNDGEACEFSAHEPELYRGGTGDDTEESSDIYGLIDREGRRHNPDYQDYLKRKRAELEAKFGANAVTTVIDLWSKLDDDILLAVFGDHKEITITKDGVTVEEHEHE